MKDAQYYKKVKTYGPKALNRKIMRIFEVNFPYALHTTILTDTDNAEKIFNDWVDIQLNKPVDRLNFEKLLCSIEKLYTEQEDLCFHLWNISEKNSSEETVNEVTKLVYKHTSDIAEAQTYIVLFMKKLKNVDIKKLLNTTKFEEGSLLPCKAEIIIDDILPIITSN